VIGFACGTKEIIGVTTNNIWVNGGSIDWIFGN
jgi:hypothetical protein